MADPLRRPISSTTKRKVPPQPDHSSILKSAKTSANGDAKGHTHPSNGTSDDTDTAAGPELPPEENEDTIPDPEPDDDEEGGRFFGTGITQSTTDALDYIDAQDAANNADTDLAPEIIDLAWLRRTTLNFSRLISKNAELRAKYESSPEKFMSSEADLDADIKTLSTLAEHTDLYPEFAKLGAAASLVSLLAHENTDIAIDALEILAELTDQDTSATPPQWDALVSVAFDADLPDLILQNLSRLDESLESDRAGVYHALSLLENLASSAPTAEKLVEAAPIIEYLVKRIQPSSQPQLQPQNQTSNHQSSTTAPITQNTASASEVLSILLQLSPLARTQSLSLNSSSTNTNTPTDIIDTLLTLISPLRISAPPPNSDSEQHAENLFASLVSLLSSSEAKTRFLAAEGIELCLIMLRLPSSTGAVGKFARPKALRVLDHACAAPTTASTSNTAASDQPNSDPKSLQQHLTTRVITASGLKPLFHTLHHAHTPSSDLAHLISLLSSLLRHLPFSSPERVRLLAKFVERDYGAVSRLLRLRAEIGARVARATAAGEEGGGDDDERLSKRLDAGLFTLQTIDVVLAWVMAEDEGVRGRVVREGGEGLLEGIRGTLRELIGGGGGEEKDGDGEGEEEERERREMLGTLLGLVA